MKISLNWLRKYVALPDSVEALDDLLTRAGVKVESIEHRGADFPNVVVAQINAADPHPNADRLKVCQVDDGSGHPRQVVCGARNYKVGDKVPLALPGAVLPGDFKIKVGKLRGVESEGMLCSAKELRLADDAEGLLILPGESPIGTPLASLFPPDTILELEITPNRADWLSHLGIAREVAAFTGASVTWPVSTGNLPGGTAEAIVVHDAVACPVYSLHKISGVKVGPSPAWLRDALESVGLRSINNVVDVTNYVMMELGQPLHAFDASRVKGALQVRRAAEGESFTALDGSLHRLSPSALVIADDLQALALAGITGGQSSGVSESTTDILLESALFDPALIRKTGRACGLSTDSSYRFERGVDPEMVVPAATRAVQLIQEVAGGQCAEPPSVTNTLAYPEYLLTLRHRRAVQLLGLDLPTSTIIETLGRVGLELVSETNDSSVWKIPGFRRRDLVREVDLIEELIRLLGIDRVVGSTIGLSSPSSPADRVYDFANDLRRQLVGMGFSEARTGTLVASAPVRLKNPLGEEQSSLRDSLLPGLLESLRRNINAGADSVALFEIGRVFSPSENQVVEHTSLALIMTGSSALPTWQAQTERSYNLFDLKGVLAKLSAGQADVVKGEGELGIHLQVIAGKEILGVAGQLSPQQARQVDATCDVLVAELRLDPVMCQLLRPRPFKEIPKFPAMRRDIAIVMDKSRAFEEVRGMILSAQVPYLENIALFDLFTDPSGEKLPADRKSLAIALTFRSPERTLTADEISKAVNGLKERLKSCDGLDFRE